MSEFKNEPSVPPPPGAARVSTADIPWFKRGWGIAAIAGFAFVLGTQVGGGAQSDEPAAAVKESEPAEAAGVQAADDADPAPDVDEVASDICRDLRSSDDLPSALRVADGLGLERGELREAVEANCPTKAIPEPSFYEPDIDDFALTVNVLEQKCYGSAGCNVTFRVELAYGGLELDPSQRYELTYEILGGDDPQIRTMEGKGDSYTSRDEDRIGTPASDSVLTAEPISLRARG
jgi:hypothetical protein